MPNPPIGPLAVAHEQHDALLVAAYAANDLDGRPKDEAAELVAGCSACAELAADVRALATATAALPPVARPRDFGLSPADAARLRPTGWRRLLRALAAPGALTRPLAASLTTLGVAGLLLAALPGMLPMAGSGAAPGPAVLERVSGSAAPSALAAPSTDVDAQGQPGSEASGAPAAPPAAGTIPEQQREAPSDANGAVGAAGEPPLLAIGSAAVLVLGLALFGLLRVAERERRDASGT